MGGHCAFSSDPLLGKNTGPRAEQHCSRRCDVDVQCRRVASPPGPAAHFSLDRLDFITVTSVAASPATAASTPKRRRKLGKEVALSQPSAAASAVTSSPPLPSHSSSPGHLPVQQPSSPATASFTEKDEEDEEEYLQVPSTSTVQYETRSSSKRRQPNM
jgi:hypothetical protein